MKPKKHKPIDLIKAAQAVVPSLIENIESIREKTLALESQQRELVRFPNETACEHALRLAKQDKQKRGNEAATREQAFMDSLFPDRTEYVKHEDGTYTICGLRWEYGVTELSRSNIHVIRDHPDNRYRNTPIFREWDDSTFSTTLIELGRVLLRRDAHVKYIDSTYPKGFWGRFFLWLTYRAV